MVALSACGGCDRDVRLTGRNIHDATVRSVTHYGLTLDQEATPQQVTYVLLRAIRDDFLATDQAARDAAIDRQLDVCAANEIYAMHSPTLDRAEVVYKVVHRWTPTIAHYVPDLETDWEKAQGRFTLRGPQPMANSATGAKECQIIMELADPSGDPNANVLLVVGLVQDRGYWRVLRVGFTPTKRSLKPGSIATFEPAAPAHD
jgi:hypothetical protein